MLRRNAELRPDLVPCLGRRLLSGSVPIAMPGRVLMLGPLDHFSNPPLLKFHRRMTSRTVLVEHGRCHLDPSPPLSLCVCLSRNTCVYLGRGGGSDVADCCRLEAALGLGTQDGASGQSPMTSPSLLRPLSVLTRPVALPGRPVQDWIRGVRAGSSISALNS